MFLVLSLVQIIPNIRPTFQVTCINKSLFLSEWIPKAILFFNSSHSNHVDSYRETTIQMLEDKIPPPYIVILLL